MPSDNKTTSKHFLELWGDNAIHLATDYLSDDYINHQMPDASGGTSTLSLDEWKNLVSSFHDGFTEVKLEMLLQVAEGDYVCNRWKMTAKHTGSFVDLAPTGKTTTWTGVQIDRYKGGKLVESWVDWNKYGWLEGLGLVG